MRPKRIFQGEETYITDQHVIASVPHYCPTALTYLISNHKIHVLQEESLRGYYSLCWDFWIITITLVKWQCYCAITRLWTHAPFIWHMIDKEKKLLALDCCATLPLISSIFKVKFTNKNKINFQQKLQ